MTETVLVTLLAGVLGVTGGKMWGIKSVEKRFLPRIEHELGCKIIQANIAAEIKSMKEEILQAIKDNGVCAHRGPKGSMSHSEE